jgi:transposase
VWGFETPIRVDTSTEITKEEHMNTVYCGIDLHSTQVTYHTISRKEDGKIVRTGGKVYTNELHQKLFSQMNKDWHLCVEASGSTFWFEKLARPFVKDITVVNPQGFKEMYLTGQKTDKIDAKKLANRIKTHVEDEDPQDNFPGVYVPKEEVQSLRKLFGMYDFYNKQIVATKNRIHGLFRSRLVSIEKADLETTTVNLVNHKDLDELLREMILTLHGTLVNHLEAKKKIKARIEALAVEHFEKEVTILTSTSGISVLGAAAIVADIATIDRFKNAKRLSRYLKSAPKVDNSNETKRTGNICKRGRKTAYSILLQGLEHIKNGNSHFKDFYDRKCKGKRKNKVRAALVRKTIVAIFYMLKNQELNREVDHRIYARKRMEITRIKKKLLKAA